MLKSNTLECIFKVRLRKVEYYFCLELSSGGEGLWAKVTSPAIGQDKIILKQIDSKLVSSD